jgi:hypothetical protein
MWRRRWHCKRQNIQVQQINIMGPEFGIFSPLFPDMLKDEEKCNGFLRMNIEQFYLLSQLVGEEILKQNTNIGGGGGFYLVDDLHFFRYVL